MTNPARTSVGTRMADAAAEALASGRHAVDGSLQRAAEAVDKVAETARGVREDAAGLARVGAASVGDAAAAAGRKVSGSVRAGRRYVAREPLKSALVAAAVGAVAAALVMAWQRANRQRDGEA